MTTLYIVIPCYNEQDVLPITAAALKEKFSSLMKNGKITEQSRVVFVDDGSSDDTRAVIKTLCKNEEMFSAVLLSRNSGHQNALLAGLFYGSEKCDAVITMDADLQDDINAVDSMLEKFQQGSDIVYGIRKNRKSDSLFKRISARGYYKLMTFWGGKLIYDHADFRLMSKRATETLKQYKEVNVFLRGIVPMLGYKTDSVYYERKKRAAGKTKYPLKKMLSFAIEGITSLSTRPISLIAYAGIAFIIFGIIMLIYSFIRYFTGNTISGWTSIFASVWVIGGIQLIAISVIGKYIGKIYLESKHRPRYIIEEIIE